MSMCGTAWEALASNSCFAAVPSLCEPCRPACRWIVDMSTAVYRNAVTVLLSSPKKDRYHEFLKLPRARKLYLDIWMDEEIRTVR